eukprot:TRINITY_DN2543_c0_g1_i3.p1 TRINITY_DN2543_c0_g1~~TRINITY_DN2543_c0_g1_i3.p1  ORF type:complete len:545 (-),score=173.26 TRINITY_DN2543_c0_g1_i3:135-1769(-)
MKCSASQEKIVAKVRQLIIESKTKLKLLQIKRDSEFDSFTKEISVLKERLKALEPKGSELPSYMQSTKKSRASVKPAERRDGVHERRRVGAYTSRMSSRDPKLQINRKESFKDLSKDEVKGSAQKVHSGERDKRIPKPKYDREKCDSAVKKDTQSLREEMKELLIRLQETSSEKTNFILLYNESLEELNEMQEKGKRDICVLNETIKDLQTKLAVSTEENERLQKQYKEGVNSLNKEIARLGRQILSTKGESVEMSGISEKDEEIERLSRDKAKSNEIISKMKDYVKTVTSKLFTAENDRNKFKKQYNELLEEYNNLKVQHTPEAQDKGLARDDSEMEAVNKKLLEENTSLQETVKELTSKLSTIEQEPAFTKENSMHPHQEQPGIIEPNSKNKPKENLKRIGELEIQQLGSVNGSLLKQGANSRCQNLCVRGSTDDFSKDTFESERVPRSGDVKVTAEEYEALLLKVKQLESKQEDYERLLGESGKELESERAKHREQLLKFKDDYCKVFKDMNGLKKALKAAQEELASKDEEVRMLKASVAS